MIFRSQTHKISIGIIGLIIGAVVCEGICRLFPLTTFHGREFVIGNRRVPWASLVYPEEYHDGQAVFKYCYDKSYHGFLDQDNCASHTVSEFGFRKSYPFTPKLSEQYRIMFLGDSFTFGDGINDDETYPAQLQQKLQLFGVGSKSIQVFNTARPGQDTPAEFNEYINFRDKVSPDLVVLQWNTNDFPANSVAQLHVKLISGEFQRLDNPPSSVAWSRLLTIAWQEWKRRWIAANLQRLSLDELVNQGGNFDKLREFRNAVEADGRKFLLLIYPELVSFQHNPYQEIIDALLRFCQETKMECINLIPELSKYPEHTLWVHPTDLHPNRIANQITAEVLFQYLKTNRIIAPLRQ